jgi:hypothetical protein
MKKHLPRLSISSFCVFAVVIAFGASGCFPKTYKERADWVASKVSSELKLDEAQEAKLQAVKQAFIDARTKRTEERKRDYEDMRKFLLSDKIEASRAKDLLKSRNQSMEQDFDGIFPNFSEFHASLNAEQKKKAVELLDSVSKRWMAD